jgi:predicted nucleic acid-binding Zn ribbon protein
MPLEACPVCGYAVSTTTSQCRHCAESPKSIPGSGNPDEARPRLAGFIWFTIIWLMIFLLYR